ncbi:PLP-dependent aminotransferase family protein (plasmid) [Massilia forsythiae]|uniref:PLP-dependent aminotransferase family protein n=1 Tax=Massilia forsythiae TaxID=2728020 RepID=A0A7Z2W2Q9_9BURK|nr:PLP-dependent aminotransferase family protein [Massilia forsythiae]QJE03675.1 PLP-dependent aminotransferase family protein [Massilia forsythiae]
MFNLEKGNGATLTDQVYAGVMHQIETNRLLQGTRLPSVRKLAGTLGVSVFTISTAYERLVSQGILVSRTGAGYFVAHRRHVHNRGGAKTEEMPIGRPTGAVSFVLNTVDEGRYDIPAGSGFLPGDWLENAVSPSVIGRLVRNEVKCSVPTPTQGLPMLRQQLATKLNNEGIQVDVEQIVITYGATQAVSMICNIMLKPNDTVFVEDPGYMLQHAIIANTGAKIVPIRRTPDGPDLDALEELAHEHRPKLFFTQTLLQNPTGTSTTPIFCYRLLSLAEKYDFHIVEDDVFSDICVHKSLRLAAMDGFQRVFYVNSFTKLMSPAMRVGFVVTQPKFVKPLVEQKVLTVLSGSSLQESLVFHALQSGRYQAHLNYLQTKLLKARSSAEQALASAGIQFDSHPVHGMFLWGQVPCHVDIDRLIEDAFQKRIFLSKGSIFSPTGSFAHHLRFNVAHSNNPALIAFLSEAIRKGPAM